MTDVESELEAPKIVQVINVENIGIPKGVRDDDDESDDEKWENKYLEAADEDDKGSKKQAETNRMLKFTLTDGLNEIVATEISKLDSLTVDIDAGSKFLLKPPMQILRSVHF